MRLAAIDIGSNAVRLLVAEVKIKPTSNEGEIYLKKLKLFRVPVRLGVEVFKEGIISEALMTKLIKTMKAFKLIMDVYEIETFKACATSAMREAKNREEVMTKVHWTTDIKINLIDGQQEAQLILSNRLADMLDPRFNHLYVDVGGGSTEVSLLKKNKLSIAKSFKIGTLRLFNEKVKPKAWEEFSKWLHKNIEPTNPLAIIGSGGNINRVFKRSGNRYGQPLMYEYLKQERDLLTALNIEDRVMLQDLTRDRAEVIVPALNIFLFTMEHANIRQVIVPKIGLADGIIRQLFQEKMKKQKQKV